MQCCSLSAVPLARRPAAFSSSRSLQMQLLGTPQGLPRRLVAVRAEEETSSAAAAAAASDDVAAEQLLRRGRKGSKGESKGSKGESKGGMGSKQGPTVIAPVRDQVYGGGPLTAEQTAENAVVSLLAIVFFVILAEGIFLAGSGFMSAELDQFAQDVVFPAFSPTLALFLAISTAYGVFKTRGDPDESK